MGIFFHKAEMAKLLNFLLKLSSESCLHVTAKLVRRQIFIENRSNSTLKQGKNHKNHMGDKSQQLIIVVILSGIAFYEK